jgi:hypothetical protein
MPDDSRYEAALTTALDIIHKLASRPGMALPEQLSIVTFSILRAMDEVERRHSYSNGSTISGRLTN